MHTTASDGYKTPAELVLLAYEKGLSTIAITDHDTIEGYHLAVEKAGEVGIRLLSGVEITSDYNGRECHILAYGFDPNSAEIADFLKNQRNKRTLRANGILDKLNKLGYEIDIDEVKAESGKATISRNHIASVLERKQFVANKREAFDRLLGGRAKAYVQNEYPEVAEVIDFIKRIGGVSILAHPGNLYIYEDLRYFLRSGLDGIEFIHPSHNYKTQKKLREYAMNYKILLSGGSDYHGSKVFEDRYLGSICVDESRADLILEHVGKAVIN